MGLGLGVVGRAAEHGAPGALQHCTVCIATLLRGDGCITLLNMVHHTT